MCVHVWPIQLILIEHTHVEPGSTDAHRQTDRQSPPQFHGGHPRLVSSIQCWTEHKIWSVHEYYDVTLKLNFDLVDIMILYHPIRRLCEMLSQAVYELLSYGPKHVRLRGHSDLWPIFGLLWFLRYCVHKNGRDRQTAGWREGTTRIHNCSHQAAASVEA